MGEFVEQLKKELRIAELLNRVKKKKLWIRRLSCGHIRLTNIAFISGIYDKPKIRDKAYCRECWKEVEIIGVEEKFI